MILNKQTIKDLKSANALVVRFNKYPTIDLFFKDNAYKVTNERVITYNLGELESLYDGAWHIGLYEYQNTHEGAIISTLRPGDDIQFSVANNGTTGLVEAGFFWQILQLTVKRHKKDGKTLQYIRVFNIADTISRYDSNKVQAA